MSNITERAVHKNRIFNDAQSAWKTLTRNADTLSDYDKEVLTHIIAESQYHESKLNAYISTL